MAKTDNLSDFLTDVANSIRTKTGTTEQINAQDFSDKILSIQTGGGSGNTLKNLLDATKSCYYLFNNYGGTSVDNLIQPNDTENVTNMSYMFNGCTNLTTIPQLNTGNVTDMNHMFEGCSNLTSIPLLDTSNVTGTGVLGMFKGCSNLTSIPQLNISNVTRTSSMFEGCTSLTTIPLLDTSNATSIGGMFRDCTNLTSIPQLNTSNITTTAYTFSYCTSLTTIPLLDTSKVMNMSATFQGCRALTTVPALDASNVTNKDNMNTMFSGCTNLKSILMTNIGADLNISSSTKFEREDLLVILNNLKTVTEARTLTMGATNLAKLTEEDKAIATNKG